MPPCNHKLTLTLATAYDTTVTGDRCANFKARRKKSRLGTAPDFNAMDEDLLLPADGVPVPAQEDGS